MMRRSALVFSAGAAKAGESALSSVVAEAPSKMKVEIAAPPPSNFMPPASEAPELLKVYVEPKPFVSPRRVQLFAVSTAVGATAVALVYFLLIQSISLNAEEEHAQVESVAGKNRHAAEERQKLFQDFAAPSSYDQLQAKMAMRDREMARLEEHVYNSTSMLNTEVIYHVKMWWNRSLANIQDAVDRAAIAQQQWQGNQIKANIKATLAYRSYKVVDLEQH